MAEDAPCAVPWGITPTNICVPSKDRKYSWIVVMLLGFFSFHLFWGFYEKFCLWSCCFGNLWMSLCSAGAGIWGRACCTRKGEKKSPGFTEKVLNRTKSEIYAPKLNPPNCWTHVVCWTETAKIQYYFMKLFRQFLPRAFQGCSALLPTLKKKKIVPLASVWKEQGGNWMRWFFKDPSNSTSLGF